MKRFTLSFSRVLQRLKDHFKLQQCASCGLWYRTLELDQDGICHDCGRYL